MVFSLLFLSFIGLTVIAVAVMAKTHHDINVELKESQMQAEAAFKEMKSGKIEIIDLD